MHALRSAIRRGTYVRINRLAEIIGASHQSVIAGAKICGCTIIPGMIFFPGTVTPEFVSEVQLINQMNTAAAARKQNHEAKTLSQNSPGPPGNHCRQAPYL